MKISPAVMLLFLVGLAGFFGFAEYRLARVAVLEVRAESFPTTMGHITSGEVASYAGSKGSRHYYPRFTYTYQVAGKSFRASRYRYNKSPSFNGRSQANQVVLAHPAGSEITVYYNPEDPVDAVLSTGVGARLVSQLFETDALLAMLVLLGTTTARRIEWPGMAGRLAGGLEIISEMTNTRVRLPRFEAGTAALVAGAGLSMVVAIFGMITSQHTTAAFDAGLAGEIAALVIGALTVIVYIWQRLRIASGKQDLVINEALRTVQLPKTYKRKDRPTVPFSDVTAVILDKVAHRGKYGVRYTYAPALQLRDGTAYRLTDLSQARAASFAEWLREKLGLSAA